MTSMTKVSEKDIAESVRQYFVAQGLTVRSEVPVVLPDHGRVTADLVGYRTTPEGEWFVVAECKRRLDETLEAQAKRWHNIANGIVVGYLMPVCRKNQNERREGRIDHYGIGRLLVDDDGEVIEKSHPQANIAARNHHLSTAFHSHDGSQYDPPAGSAAAKRLVGDRILLVKIAEYVGDGMTIKEINQHPMFRTLSAHRLRKLIDSERTWNKLPLDYRGGAISNFFRLEVA